MVPLVPGFFMMTRSEKELEQIVPELVKRRVENYLREVFSG